MEQIESNTNLRRLRYSLGKPRKGIIEFILHDIVEKPITASFLYDYVHL